jgi:hypothetical protein
MTDPWAPICRAPFVHFDKLFSAILWKFLVRTSQQDLKPREGVSLFQILFEEYFDIPEEL